MHSTTENVTVFDMGACLHKPMFFYLGRMHKKKLSSQEQIQHMSSKGITFNYINENDAKLFLEDNNYYFRIKSYAKNYQKYNQSERQGKYINLDFAYLKELSSVDLLLRRILLKMTLDIEHNLKVNLLKLSIASTQEDGYSIIQDFFANEGAYIKANIETLHQHHSTRNSTHTSYTANLITKYHPDYSIWNIIEIISFGDFIQLFKFCHNRLATRTRYNELLWSTKIIRNACAHNNCLLNNLSSRMRTQMSNKVRDFLLNNPETVTHYHKHRLCYVMMDIISVCYFYHLVRQNKKEKQATFIELQETVINRVFRSGYFAKNTSIRENFELLDKVIKQFIV